MLMVVKMMMTKTTAVIMITSLMWYLQEWRERAIKIDYKTFKQTTGTMIPLVYVGSIVI